MRVPPLSPPHIAVDPRIGAIRWLMRATLAWHEAFRLGRGDLGYSEGQSIVTLCADVRKWRLAIMGCPTECPLRANGHHRVTVGF
jgi:hypothetical protein